jgi:hypothetical protein
VLRPAVKGFESDLVSFVELLLQGVAKIEAAPSLLASINRHAFVQNGLSLVDGPTALCATQPGTWSNCERICATSWSDHGKLRLFVSRS